MLPVQVADGFSVVMPKSTRSNASVMKARAMVRGYATPTTKTMTDTPPARATYKMGMNQISTGAVGLGIDGQTQAYIDVKGAKAKALFSSKNVPMTDGTELLTGCNKKVISQRGYGNIVARKPVAVPGGDRIGFNNTLVDTSKGKIEPSMAYTKTYPNHTVCSDFPKGPGGVEPNPMWEDGTYDEMLEQVQKVHNEVPREMAFVPEVDRRREVFNLQSLAGGEVYGEALLRKEIGDSVLAQKRDLETSRLSRLFPEATFGELQEAQGRLERGKRIGAIAKRLGISEEAAEELEDTVGETGLRNAESLLREGDSRAAEVIAPGFNQVIGKRRTVERFIGGIATRKREHRADEERRAARAEQVVADMERANAALATRTAAANKIAALARGVATRQSIGNFIRGLPPSEVALMFAQAHQRTGDRDARAAAAAASERAAADAAAAATAREDARHRHQYRLAGLRLEEIERRQTPREAWDPRRSSLRPSQVKGFERSAALLRADPDLARRPNPLYY